MPTYEYKCQSCSHYFETFQNITADPLTDCPECKNSSLKRLISSGGGILFKGSGFYETDYRSKNYQEQAKKEKDSDSNNSSSTGKDSQSSSSSSESSSSSNNSSSSESNTSSSSEKLSSSSSSDKD